MEIIRSTDLKAVSRAADVLRRGGFIVYPTDTIYGLGVDATNEEAIRKVYEVKMRPESKPMHVVVSDLEAAGPYVEITPLASKLARAFLPGPLTLVLKAKDGVPPLLMGGTGTLGIRVPNNAFCLALAREFGKPFTTTSANRSGAGNPFSLDDLQMMLGPAYEQVSLVVDGGTLPQAKPSTFVDARGTEPVILRVGDITEEMIQSA